MIKFGSNDKVENIGILEKEEAEAYVDFLAQERARHKLAMGKLGADMKCWKVENDRYNKALIEFYQSAIRRHRKDIEEIDHLVGTVRHFFSL